MMREELVATPDAPSMARRLLGVFLDDLGWAVHDRDDLIAAVSEAVTLAVRYAHPTEPPGPVVLSGELLECRDHRRRIRLSVLDWGRHRDTGADERSWEVKLMKAATAQLSIDTTPVGTHATLISNPETRKPRPAAALPCGPPAQGAESLMCPHERDNGHTE
jgi:anti-sigma regulatory factor (Ser/Thr protein kinase)